MFFLNRSSFEHKYLPWNVVPQNKVPVSCQKQDTSGATIQAGNFFAGYPIASADPEPDPDRSRICKTV